MSKTVIQVDNLSKQYRLGLVGTGTLQHDINRWWHKFRGMDDPYLKVTESNDRSIASTSGYVWALRGLDFSVNEGEVLGIIGRNGAGKSTLLKILSRVTGPSTGTIKVKGRISALLEVGTGFHQELTGRENVYLNGAIHGMNRQEVSKKLDEIVEFSGCERYLDTPVKRYSSGMTVRLGFAVAAHLEPEILIVDEVLAVGDAEFQKKCIGKMKDVAGEGRTVLFVSHNMTSIRKLCDKCMIMNQGATEGIYPTEEAVIRYLETGISKNSYIQWDDQPNLNGYFKEIRLTDKEDKLRDSYECDEDLIIHLDYELKKPSPMHYLTLYIMGNDGNIILFSDIRDQSGNTSNLVKVGSNTFSVKLPGGLLAPGEYLIKIGSADSEAKTVVHQPEETCLFRLKDFKTQRENRYGYLRTILNWQSE